jgi:uncharacterized protein YdhG (YjbR/CyaY superfamily)
MQNDAKSVDDYIAGLPEERRGVINDLRATINKSIPKGFVETMSYGMIGWVVPHSIYPKGYHCDPKLPLPFLSIASQKNFVAVYHMGVYADAKLMDWFTTAWPEHSSKKLDMGKSCIRFKKPEDVPMKLVGQLAKKMTPKQWIEMYESAFTRK